MGFSQVYLVLILFIKVMQKTCSQSITINLPDGEILCPGREIVFRCEVHNSLTIAWRSNEYIQRDGNTIRFATFDDPGMTKSNAENPTTIATFVNKSSNTLVSDLRIILSSVYPTPSVTCLHNNGTTVSKLFQVITTPPGVPSEKILNQTVDVSENCVLHLSWSSPESSALSHYMIYLNGEHVVNKTHTNSPWQLFAYPVCTCGSHNVSIRAVNRCGHVGPSTDNQTVDSTELPAVACPGEQSHQTTTNAQCPEIILESQTQSALIGGIIFPVIVAVFFIITTIVFLVLWLLSLKNTSDNRRQGTESDNVNQFNETQSGDIKDDSSKNTGLQKRKKIKEDEL